MLSTPPLTRDIDTHDYGLDPSTHTCMQKHTRSPTHTQADLQGGLCLPDFALWPIGNSWDHIVCIPPSFPPHIHTHTTPSPHLSVCITNNFHYAFNSSNTQTRCTSIIMNTQPDTNRAPHRNNDNPHPHTNTHRPDCSVSRQSRRL